jgi:hypothetical protein
VAGRLSGLTPFSAIYSSETGTRPEVAACYYIAFMCSHIYHMRQRGILGDNEWQGWLQWTKNSFRFGSIAKYWKEAEMETWFDPAFRDFVNKEILSSTPGSK